MRTEFHLLYRPTTWNEVLGQKATVLSIRKALKAGRSRAFLFIGPSGTGKTTLARLVASDLGCVDDNIIEVDGASTTSIDAVRELSNRLQYATIDGSPRCVIYDELSYVSKAAMTSLLKIIEEPPPGVVWCLCTSEGDKIPKSIQTRCSTHVLRPVADDLILGLLQRVRGAEELKISDEGLDLIVESSSGSPRQALVYLGAVADFKNLDSIRSILTQTEAESSEAIELCRLLLSGNSSWRKVAAILKSLTIPAESVRLLVLKYMSSVALGSGDKAQWALEIMSNFQTPFLDREGMAPLILACANVVYGSEE